MDDTKKLASLSQSADLNNGGFHCLEAVVDVHNQEYPAYVMDCLQTLESQYS
jgi:hypothetical protein